MTKFVFTDKDINIVFTRCFKLKDGQIPKDSMAQWLESLAKAKAPEHMEALTQEELERSESRKKSILSKISSSEVMEGSPT